MCPYDFWFIALIAICLLSGFSLKSSSKIINISIKENTQPRSELLNLRSRLPILQKDNSHKFEIISGNNKLRNLLQLNSVSGSFHLISSVDREELCQSSENDCFHTIIISFGSIIFEVIFSIIDLNDEIPTFLKHDVEISILEDVHIGHLIDLPVASDLDSPIYGIANYMIEYNKKYQRIQENLDIYFKLQKTKDNSGKYLMPQLKLLKSLNREVISRYVFTLVAIDTEDKKGYVNILLNIEDVNDNSPQWVGLPFQISLNECTSTREIFKLKAVDIDDPNSKNSKLEFKIDLSKVSNFREISRIFYISGDNVVLIDGGLKGMAETRIKIPLKVSDGGGLQNITDLTIHVKDCNDFTPQISISSRSAKVKENRKVQEILTLLTVKDEDMELNCEFSCYLNDTRYLQLKEVMSRSMAIIADKTKKGMITIYQIETLEHNSFDRESISFYSVLVICNDRGTPSLTSSQQFNIIVQDENDNSPIFERSYYYFEIPENAISSSDIGTVSAPDLDSEENARIKYTINEFGNRYFAINTLGNIVSKQRFDREQRSFYNFTITASDHGKPTKTSNATVSVKILDVNDCKPIFKNNYHFNIIESYGKMTINSDLGFIEATDDDEGKNGLVSYSIAVTNPRFDDTEKEKRKTFNAQITKSGKLSIYGVVDREEHSTIFIDVIARDHGKHSLSSITTVTITVLDLNDNKPIFTFPSSASGTFVNVSVDSEVGHLIAKLEAVDNDYGANGTVTFEIVGNESLSAVSIERDGRVILRESIKSRHHRPYQSDRILVRALDQSEESPLSEVGSIILRYIWPSKNNINVYPNNGKKNYNKSPDKYFNEDSDSKYYNSNYIVILYGLAAVVFVVFLIVICVLIYFYSAGRGLNGLMERKQPTKSQSIKLQPANNQSEFFDSTPFENGELNNIYGYQNITDNQPALYQMQNIDTNYMQLMSNPSSSRCQTYTPINIYPSNFNKFSSNSFNIHNSYSAQCQQDQTTMFTTLTSPIGSLPFNSEDKSNGTMHSNNKSKTFSSMLHRKCLNKKDNNSSSLSSIDSKNSDKNVNSQVDNKFLISKDPQHISHLKINESYISSSFV